jgi:hypothetical protein
MSNKDMAAALAAIVALLSQQGITVPTTKPVKARKAKAKAEPKAKRKKGATPAQRAHYNSMKTSHPCPFRPGMVEREAYRAAKAAGLIG